MWSRVILLLILMLISCRESPRKGDNIEASTPPSTEADSYSGETQTSWDYCYASRTPTPEEFGDTYNYQFVRLHVDSEGNATGMMINAPYGTDGSRGSISGVYRHEDERLQSTTSYLAEGELYEEQRDYQLGEKGLSTLNADGEAVFGIPSVSCEQFDRYLAEYRTSILKNRVNTSDRSRLKKVKEVQEFGYSEAKLDSLRFLELEIDLDGNYQTREYLLYLMDPMVCGSGGCNLLVIDTEGNTLSGTTVVKLPIYTTTALGGKGGQEGWKTLYVWSRGWRELQPEAGTYPSNASMAPEVPEEELTGHPEKYHLILDYLE